LVIIQHLTWRALFCCALLISGILEAVSQGPPEILELSDSYITISQECADDEPRVVKGQFAGDPYSYEGPAIIGSIRRENSSITFVPLVPFNQETNYTVLCDGELLHFSVGKPSDYDPIEIIQIYPSVKQVPANILKWYVRFSRPVNPVKIYEHIHFLDQEGAEIDRSILNLKAPLLSDDGTLLTIWVEPGRQKRLLGPNHHLGSVFEPYKNYTLQIGAALKDMKGVSMDSTIRHSFVTTDVDRKKPSMTNWEIGNLQAHTSDPMTIIIPEQVDYGSLIDSFELYYHGVRVAGTIEYNSDTFTISFLPDQNWKAGDYTIRLDTHLEDLAGNNLSHLFDRPITQKQAQETAEQYMLFITCE